MYAKKKKYAKGGGITKLPPEILKMLMEAEKPTYGGVLDEATVVARKPDDIIMAAANAYSNSLKEMQEENSSQNSLQKFMNYITPAGRRAMAGSAYMVGGLRLGNDQMDAAWKDYRNKQAELESRIGNPTENYSDLSEKDKELFKQYLIESEAIGEKMDALEGNLEVLQREERERQNRGKRFRLFR